MYHPLWKIMYYYGCLLTMKPKFLIFSTCGACYSYYHSNPLQGMSDVACDGQAPNDNRSSAANNITLDLKHFQSVHVGRCFAHTLPKNNSKNIGTRAPTYLCRITTGSISCHVQNQSNYGYFYNTAVVCVCPWIMIGTTLLQSPAQKPILCSYPTHTNSPKIRSAEQRCK